MTLPRPARPVPGGAWPHTTRPLPWVVASFVVMLVLLPFDSTELPVSLPIEPTLDRFAILVFVVVWLALASGPVAKDPGWPSLGLIGVGVLALSAVAAVSILANATALETAGESEVAVKRLALLLSYGLFLVLVSTSIRPADVPSLLRLLIAAGCLCALGVIFEYRTDVNVFFDWTRSLTGSVLDIEPEPVAQYDFARRVVTGPARHGLAVTAMLAMIAPFALAFAMQARERRARLLYVVAFGLLVIGAISTLRRTSIVAPLALLTVFALYRPRRLLPLATYALPGILLMSLLAPGAGGSLLRQVTGSNTLVAASNQGRMEDYVAVSMDVLHRPLLGRGYGAYQPDRYRILDNQFLLLLVEVGLLGVACFIVVLAGTWLRGHRLQRTGSGWERWVGVAAVAVTAVFVVLSAIFDTLSFSQPAYTFMLVAALLTVVASSVAPAAVADGSPSIAAPVRVATPILASPPAVRTRARSRRRGILLGLALVLLRNRRRRR